MLKTFSKFLVFASVVACSNGTKVSTADNATAAKSIATGLLNAAASLAPGALTSASSVQLVGRVLSPTEQSTLTTQATTFAKDWMAYATTATSSTSFLTQVPTPATTIQKDMSALVAIVFPSKMPPLAGDHIKLNLPASLPGSFSADKLGITSLSPMITSTKLAKLGSKFFCDLPMTARLATLGAYPVELGDNTGSDVSTVLCLPSAE